MPRTSAFKHLVANLWCDGDAKKGSDKVWRAWTVSPKITNEKVPVLTQYGRSGSAYRTSLHMQGEPVDVRTLVHSKLKSGYEGWTIVAKPRPLARSNTHHVRPKAYAKPKPRDK
jgi:hypothetical protein